MRNYYRSTQIPNRYRQARLRQERLLRLEGFVTALAIGMMGYIAYCLIAAAY